MLTITEIKQVSNQMKSGLSNDKYANVFLLQESMSSRLMFIYDSLNAMG